MLKKGNKSHSDYTSSRLRSNEIYYSFEGNRQKCRKLASDRGRERWRI